MKRKTLTILALLALAQSAFCQKSMQPIHNDWTHAESLDQIYHSIVTTQEQRQFQSSFGNTTVTWLTLPFDVLVSSGIKVTHYIASPAFTARPEFALTLDFDQLQTVSSFSPGKNELDISSQIIYAPSFNQGAQAGIKLISHQDIHYGDFLEQDLLAGLFGRFHPTENLTMETELLYMKKLAWIYAISETSGSLNTDGLGFRFAMEYNPVPWFTSKFQFSSYSTHFFPQFFAPDFLLGFDFKITEFFTAGVSMDAQYLDMFTLSGNLLNIGVNSYISIRL